MPQDVKDAGMDRLGVRLSSLRKPSKTEVVRQALLNEHERVQGQLSLVDLGLAFCQALRKGDPALADPADKAFVDDLYEVR